MSLYRKYRSQTLDEIIGQDHIVQTLKNALVHDKVSHAYLFAGPRGTGKTSIARILAKEMGLDAMDIIEIDAASHRGIDEVRALREEVQFQPVSSDKKIYILDEAHMLTKDAFNALLKTLEEPPHFVYFVLCTTEPHKLPVTIISRTQRFDFSPGTVENLSKLIHNILQKEDTDLPGDVVALIAKQADGGYRDAVSLLEQVLQISRSETFLQDVHQTLGIVMQTEVDTFVHALIQKDRVTALQQIDALVRRNIDYSSFYKSVLSSLRVYLLNNLNTKDYHYIRNLLFAITESARNVKYTPVPSIPLELVILDALSSDVIDKTPEVKEENVAVIEEIVKDDAKGELENSTVVQSKEMTWWPEVLIAIKPHNHTLEALLKGSVPNIVNENTMKLTFKYKFHKDRIEEPANKAILVDVIKQVSGTAFTVQCVLGERNELEDKAFHGTQSTEVITVNVAPHETGKKSSSRKSAAAGTIHESGEDMLEKALNDLGGKMIQ